MKALTICQPYAFLIVRGEKLMENREWPTNYRGQLVIHAGKSRDWMDADEVRMYETAGITLHFGSVIGVAKLVDVVRIDHIKRGDYDTQYPWLKDHRHTLGTWCWVLKECKTLENIPWKGQQGLWDFPDELLPFGMKDLHGENKV